MSLKRRRSEGSLFQDKPTDLLIITADSDTPLAAHSGVLGLFNRVVDDLPRASSGKTTWDLSKLVLEGQSSPVSSAVVRQWLDLVYSRVDGSRQPPKFTSLSEAARSLLLFTDAVGTSQIALDAAGDALASQPGLMLPVVVNSGGPAGGGGAAGGGGGADPPPLQLELALRGKLYYTDSAGALRAYTVPSSEFVWVVVSAAQLTPHSAALPGAVAAALEGWLYLAGRLGLVALVRLLLGFFRAQLVASSTSLFFQTAPQVFSRRVLECMPHELLVEGFVTCCLSDPHVGRVDIPSGSKLNVVLTSPEAAAWYLKPPSTQVVGEPAPAANLLREGCCSNSVRMCIGGLTLREQQAVLQQVLQQLEEGEAED